MDLIAIISQGNGSINSRIRMSFAKNQPNKQVDFHYKALQPLIIIMVAMTLLAGCINADKEAKMENLDNAIVQIEINGRPFDIPIRYMYGETIEKRGHWPKVKKDRVKVDYINLSMLLPDLRPYYKEDDARWTKLGQPERISVSVMKPVGGPGYRWFEAIFKYTNDFASQGRFYRKEPDRYGLVYFSTKTGGQYYDIQSRSLSIVCHNPIKDSAGSCGVKSHYRDDIVFEYSYGLAYLPQWQEIDNNLKALLAGFSQPSKNTLN